MSVASGTSSTAELVALYQAAHKLSVMLRPFNQGDATGGAAGKDGQFTKAQIDTQIAAVSTAITAVNA